MDVKGRNDLANGLGGTTNLLASVALVAAVLTGVGLAVWRSRYQSPAQWPDAVSLTMCASSVALGIAAGLIALHVGAKHFSRIEV